jgi:hypothetical protein
MSRGQVWNEGKSRGMFRRLGLVASVEPVLDDDAAASDATRAPYRFNSTRSIA